MRRGYRKGERKVVTYMDTRGGQISLCTQHQRKRRGDWPRNRVGEEYATVSRGAHAGTCALCEPLDAAEVARG